MSQGFCSPVINTVRVSVGVSVDAGGAGGDGAGGGGGEPDGGGAGEPTGAVASAEELPPPHAQSALVTAPKESEKKIAARFMINSLSRAIQPLRFHRIDALIELSGRRRFDHSATQTNFALVQNGLLSGCDRPLWLAKGELEVFTVD